MSTMHGNSAAMAARDWAQTLVPYRRASAARAILELAVTVLPFIALWTAMVVASRHGQYWLSFVMAPFAAGLLVRLFMILARLRTRRVPSEQDRQRLDRSGDRRRDDDFFYDHWRRSHAIHHATSENLDRRGIGDIKTLTVREYLSRSWRDRLRYRLYRHPLVMFGVGPIYLFLIENRLPFGFMRKGSMPWLSTMTTNAGILLAAALLIWVAGLAPFLSVHLPIVALGATAGVWLFYVQHQFEGADLGSSQGMEPARGGPARQLVLRTAAAAQLVLRQYRRASRASPVERHSVLSASGGPAGSSRAEGGWQAQSLGQPRLRAPRAVG